jgi:sugar phosphate isomerase/epimerase
MTAPQPRRIALCNEVVADRDFPRQCALAAALGYDGLEIAPFTLSDEPHRLATRAVAALRRAAKESGIRVSGLHWLLLRPGGLSITAAEAAVRRQTREVIGRMIALCAELGGRILVHGSPAQRRLPPPPAADDARARALEMLAAAAKAAEAAGVVYCVEPLDRSETNFINTLEEAAAIVRTIGSPALRTMVDCCAAARGESLPPGPLLDRWLPSGLVAHVQVNDPNQRGPGQGAVPFAPVLAALRRHAYDGWIAVEPFDYHPDGAGAAARAIGYLRGIDEALAWRA